MPRSDSFLSNYGVLSMKFIHKISIFKISIFLLGLLSVILTVQSAYAGPAVPGTFTDIAASVMNPSTIPMNFFDGTVAAVICTIRLQLCGKVELVIVATAIVILGFLILANKMSWTYALLISICIILFIHPEILVVPILRIFMGFDIPVVSDGLAVFGRICTCKYVNMVPWF